MDDLLSVEATAEPSVRALYESTNFMIGLVELPDDNADIIHVFDSAATHRFFGFPQGAMQGRTASDLGVPQAVIDHWVRRYRESERLGREVRFEYDHPSENGALKLASSVACVGRVGQHTRFSYVTEDITERVLAEQKLRDRDTHLLLAMEASLAIAFEWDVLRDRVRRLQSVEQALPETEGDTLEGVAEVVHPDDRAMFLGNVRAALRSEDGIYRSEHRIVRPDGVVRWLFENGRVEFDAEHRPLRLVGISQDITERRHAEERIRQTAQLIDLSHEAILAFGDEGGIVEWNRGAERLYGYTKAEAVGRVVHELLRTQHAEPTEAISACLEASGEWTGELTHTSKDGREIVVESRQQVIRVHGRRLVLESNRDITERKRAEAALREADRRKDEFIAVLAHELRNPLAPVRNAAEILRRLELTDSRVTRARDIIDRQVSHMARLIDDLLDASRIARGKLALHRERCDVAAIAQQTAEDYRSSLETSGLTLQIVRYTEPLWVEGDPVRLAQMVGNLLNNAGRFTERGGRVELRAEHAVQSRAALVHVIDTGVGIEPELLSRLFDPFSQADQDLARTKGGLGLGLAITKGLAELHGGSVMVRSEGPHQGATFTLRIPLSQRLDDEIAAEDSVAETRSKLRVLVVEDNEDAAESMGDLLELSGYEVKLAFDGSSALAVATEFRPDVVISDLGLPGELDGYGLARALREHAPLERTYLIALSGYTTPEAKAKAREAGFDTHLAKPPDFDKLDAMLSGIGKSRSQA